METKDIIHNLNAAAVSKHGIPNELLLDIDAALKERDELRSEFDRKISALALSNSIWMEADKTAHEALKERDDLRATLARIEGIINERDELRTLLSSIQDAAECMPVPGGYAYTIDGVTMGKIDAALGVGR